MTPEAQRTREAVRALAAVLRTTAEDLQRLAERTEALHGELGVGRLLRDVVPSEPQPLIIGHVSAVLERLAEAGAELRRAEAVQLRAEGMTQQEIADLYGVTRQRVSALLAVEGATG